MPFTLNGVGTRYAGRGNVSAVQGDCPFCRRFVRLSSYDTRECFCVLFIPIIPLRKFRILNDCSICRRHHRIPFDQFQGDLTARIEPLRLAVEGSPGDVEARLRLVEGLMGFQMSAEAEQAAREALAVHPSDARLNRFLAGLLALRGKLRRDPFLPAGRRLRRRATRRAGPPSAGTCWPAARPPRPRASWSRRGASIRAIPSSLISSGRPWPGRSGGRKPWRLRAGREPGSRARRRPRPPAPHPGMQAGPRLSAHRPGTESRAAVVAVRPLGERPLAAAADHHGARAAGLLGLGLALVGLAVIFAATALWRQRQNEVYFDNGLKRPVRVTLDGEAFPSRPGRRW